ncbi:ATP-binding cassette protein subfamily H, member 2 [Novymonas esmeraldas]|uniref:ATP-binding cassette protein subfamily H, member 2 n=1 Tax=Novymonas esmeraldas TaxID=1808958 RepID=A0AAW0F396_9TRYP
MSSSTLLAQPITEVASPSSAVMCLREETTFSVAEPTHRSGQSLAAVAAPSELSRQQVLQSGPVVLRLCHIGKSYPIAGSDERVVALKDITLAEPEHLGTAPGSRPYANPLQRGALPPPFAPVRRGEFVMIRGPSGGGKTTLLNIIGSIDSCSEGTIELNERHIDKHTKESVLSDIRLKALGFVFQTFNLIATMTAAENVELPMTLLGKLSAKEMRLRSRQLLTLVGLRNRINHLPSELSGGEQQRVTIARSLANNPSLLLLDEPTGDLDTANTIEVMDLLMRINRRTKTTCIMVTHNPDIECYADRILYVSDGRFAKEVYNALPTCLNLQGYTAYLAAKEHELTNVTRIGGGDADGDGEAASSSAGGTEDNEDGVHDMERIDSGVTLTESGAMAMESMSEVRQMHHDSASPQMQGPVRHPLVAPMPSIPSFHRPSHARADTKYYDSAAVPSATPSSAPQHREEREA